MIGSWIRLHASVKRADNGLSLSSAPVTFKLQGNTIGTSKTDRNGDASIDLNITETFRPEKGAQVYAQFAGDGSFKGSSGTANANVFSGDSRLVVTAPSGKTGSTVTVKVQLRSRNAVKDGTYLAIPNRKLQLTLDGKAAATVTTDAKGIVNWPYKIPTKGGHRLDVAFATGDRFYGGCSDTEYFSGL